MKKLIFPTLAEARSALVRPALKKDDLQNIVSNISQTVQKEGDQALINYTKKFDGITLEHLQVSPSEIKEAIDRLDTALKNAIHTAINNITVFHSTQKEKSSIVETMPGVACWRKSVPIQKVGLYIPGGTAPLFSTVLMLGIPAKIAGCEEIVLCSPPNKDGKIHPAILFAAHAVGIQKIFKVGGAQAIAALAHGTESIPNVFKIFGPGNQFVTAAKMLVSQNLGVAIDMPAGPSEVMVYAGKGAQPDFVAADLLSQAEHGKDSQVVLLTMDADFIPQLYAELEKQLLKLPRKDIAAATLNHSTAIVVGSLDEVKVLINEYAPEHLIIADDEPHSIAEEVYNAGSIFLGHYSPESIGDYASGTNHTLPTNGFAKSFSGVSLDSFLKKITFQELSREGLQNIGPTVEIMAKAEQLDAHSNAVSLRLKRITPSE
ncbi:MAG: histidinol dehydrogenase [Saprospiraceae bacterium]|jgi:histidinol dehydrogenase